MFTKKTLGVGLVVGLLALAFAALPAMASAAELTDASGTVAPETTITATSTNAETTIVGGGLLVCEHVEVSGIVTSNGGGTVAATGDGEGAATNCKLNGSPTEVKPFLDSLHLEGSTGTASFHFEVEVEPGVFVTDTSTSTVSWESGSSSVHIQGPVSGAAPGEFHGDFSLSDKEGPVTVD